MDRRTGVVPRRATLSAQTWLTPAQRSRAQIPETVIFQEKWRIALTLLRRGRAAGFTITAVVGDAEFGENATLRRTLHRAKLPYALGVSSALTVSLTPPPPPERPPATHARGRPRTRPVLPAAITPITAAAVATARPRRAWRVITWRNGSNRPWRARFIAVRVTPAHDWRHRQRTPEVWLLCERDLEPAPRTK